MKQIAILGFGTVGSGVYEMLKENAEKIRRSCREALCVKYILDIRDFSDREDAALFTKDFNVILDDPEVSIVAEVIGGIHPAYDFTKAALIAGKSVVTSNKELVASCGTELLAIAKEHNVNYLFEASVGGGIPVIRPLHESLSANEITAVGGILNGTTNYILSEMFRAGRDFDEALADAQKLGYAERDPASDIDGPDACRKIAILMALVMGKNIPVEKIHTEGIRALEQRDVAYASALGGVIKLIGYGYRDEQSGRIFAAVCPTILSLSHPIASTNGVFNMISASGNAVGDVMFYGRGAGKLPTASAVVADICDIARAPENKGYLWEDADEADILPYEEAKECYFVRVSGSDRDAVRRAFGDAAFFDAPDGADEFAFISPRISNAAFDAAVKTLPVIKKIRINGDRTI